MTIKHPIAEQFGERHLTIQEQELFHKALRRTAAKTAGRTVTMTTPTPTPAPAMTAERLADSLRYAARRAQLERDEFEGDLDLAATLDDLLAHIDALTAERDRLREAREKALEEAAARCDAIAQKVFEIRMLSQDMRGFDIQPAGCAAAIRALKDTTP